MSFKTLQADWNMPGWTTAYAVDAPVANETVIIVDLDPSAGYVFATVTGIRPAKYAEHKVVVEYDADWDSVVYWPTTHFRVACRGNP